MSDPQPRKQVRWAAVRDFLPRDQSRRSPSVAGVDPQDFRGVDVGWSDNESMPRKARRKALQRMLEGHEMRKNPPPGPPSRSF